MANEALTSIELEKFEQLIFLGDFVGASNYFHGLLNLFVREGGKSIPTLLLSPGVPGELPQLLTRLCSAIGQVIVRPEFVPSIPNLETLMSYQSILSKIFALTPFVSTDYLLQELIRADENGITSGTNILKTFLLFSTESKLTERLHNIGRQSLDLYTTTCLMMIWGCTGSQQSCENREWAYSELNDLFNEKNTLSLPLGLVHGFFMHSSYGFSQEKHRLKFYINQIIHQSLPAYKIDANDSEKPLKPPKLTRGYSKAIPHKKPVLLVVLEHFHPQHSVYRVLGLSLQACKEHFTLVAVGWPGYVKQLPKDFFDIEITLSGTGANYCLDELFGIVSRYKPVAVYYPSIGMSPWSIYYSNTRLAPVQFTAVGHGASSFATEIDYFLIEEDIAGDRNTYSEKLIRLPIGSMPFYPPVGIEYHPRKFSYSSTADQETIQIVCCSTTIKLNVHLLQICQRLEQKYRAESTGKSIAFTFLLQIYSGGIDFEIYRQLILRYLPNAMIYVDLPFQVYLDKLALMDIALSPFPYGNMNGLIDCATLGVISVCMEGPQVHEAIDGGMMRRMGMPEWLITKNEVDYEAAVCRLIEEKSERITIRENLIWNKSYQCFFNGDPSIFAKQVKEMTLKESKLPQIDHLT